MLDGAKPSACDGLLFKAIEAAGPLTPFQRLGGRALIALDGSERCWWKKSMKTAYQRREIPLSFNDHHFSHRCRIPSCAYRRNADSEQEIPLRLP
jgi:hypothetical protein